jgi:tRNA-dihydrouridine synthase B
MVVGTGGVIRGINAASPVFLAPMAGTTDLPFRTAVLRHGAGLVVSEMIASREVLSASRSARARAELGLAHARTAVQIAGNEPDLTAEAARRCAGEGARIVDLNFGCPAKKVTSGWSGSALMRDPDLALRIIEAVAAAVEVPVTVKMRLGWDEGSRNAPQIARFAEGAGARMITVHGRTRCQFYKGRADWAAIGQVKANVSIPVIANGDIVCPDSAREALALSGADGVMVGRGAQGRPWLLSGIAEALAGRRVPAAPEGDELRDLVIAHYEDILSFYGRELGVRVARKHLGWYLDRLAGAEALRARIIRMTDPRAVIRDLNTGVAWCDSSRARAAA